MAIKLTAESFLNVVKKSGLVEADRLAKLLNQIEQAGIDTKSAQAIANQLIERKAISRWQAEKLLQGKHKGFFLGKYRLESLLGKGGMSKVYLAEHVLMRRRCALKVLPPQRVDDSSYLGRFHREAQAVAQLDHVNIVRAYDVDQEDEVHFLAMEYVEGSDLQERVQDQGPASLVDAADFIRQSAEGLAHAHEANMVHRDIKPGNLLVDLGGTVKILDLGLARFFQEGDEESLTVANEEKVLGTADYLAPEQALDSHSVDARADIYSLGCTLYFLLTGHPPFTEGTLAQRLLAHQTKTPAPITDDRPDVPRELVAIAEQMMEKDPDKRYQSSRDVVDALTQWLIKNGGEEWKQRNPTLVSGSDVGGEPPATAAPVAAPVAAPAAPVAAPIAQAAPVAAAPVAQAATAKPAASPVAVAQASAEASNEGGFADFLSNLDSGGTATAQSTARVAQAVVPETKVAHAAATAVASVAEAAPVANEDRSEQPAESQAVAEAVPAAAPANNDMPDFSSFESPSDSGFPSFDAPSSAPVREAAPIAEAAPVAEASPVVAEAAPAVAEPSDSSSTEFSPTPSAIMRRRGSGKSKKRSKSGSGASGASKGPQKGKLIIAGAAVLVVIAAAAFIFSGGTENASGDGPEGKGKKSGYSVGKGGRFKTITKAIEAIVAEGKKSGSWTVEVAAGDYNESVVIDNTGFKFPSGVKIVGENGAKLIAKSGPALSLKSVRLFAFEGFQIQAQENGIEISGQGDGLRIANVQIRGYSNAGIQCRGVYGTPSEGSQITLEGIDCSSESGAAGIQFSGPADYVEVRGCRFIAPGRVGISFEDSVENQTIAESIFATADVGVRFGGSNATAKKISVTNNTFHQLKTGIQFASQPNTFISSDIRIIRNAFGEITGSPARVEKDYERGDFNRWLNGSKENAFSSSKPDPKDHLDIFKTSSKFGKDLKFASSNSGAVDFLKPGAGSPLAGLGEADGLKPYIGAVAP